MANLHDWGHLTLAHFLKSNYDTPREETIGRIGCGLVAFSVFPGSIPLCFCCALVQEKLHPEEFGDRGGAVKMAAEPVLQSIAGRRELESKPVYLLVRKWREIPSESRVLLKHLETRHADNRGCDRQAERIAQQGIHAGFGGTTAEKKFLTGDLHSDNAEIFVIGGRKREFFKAAVARCIQRHASRSIVGNRVMETVVLTGIPQWDRGMGQGETEAIKSGPLSGASRRERCP